MCTGKSYHLAGNRAAAADLAPDHPAIDVNAVEFRDLLSRSFCYAS
jgi:hypothetical protein